MLDVRLEGEKALRRAIRRHPQEVKRQGRKLFSKLKTAYQRTIVRNPWQVGGTGGGVPVATGNLRDSHQYDVGTTRLKIHVRDAVAESYGINVHEGTSKMEERPWLDYAHEKQESTRKREIGKFMDKIVNNLAD